VRSRIRKALNFSTQNRVDRIVFCVFLDRDVSTYERELQNFFPLARQPTWEPRVPQHLGEIEALKAENAWLKEVLARGENERKNFNAELENCKIEAQRKMAAESGKNQQLTQQVQELTAALRATDEAL